MFWHRRKVPVIAMKDTVCRRRKDGALFIAHHGGEAEAMASLFAGGGWYMLRARRWRGRIVASGRVVWHVDPDQYGAFDVVGEQKVWAIDPAEPHAGRRVA